MHRIILACALACVLVVPAKTDETLKFRVVQYAASAQSQQVGDVNGHIQWFGRLPGLASFPDGSTAKTVVPSSTSWRCQWPQYRACPFTGDGVFPGWQHGHKLSGRHK
jgi:hypothetical protein